MAKIFSIVTPSYNQGKFIAKTLESVLSQAGDFYIDFIILDAVSTDNSVDEIKKYEQLLKQNCDLKEIDGLQYYTRKSADFKFNQWAPHPFYKGFLFPFQWATENWVTQDFPMKDPSLRAPIAHLFSGGIPRFAM